MSIALFAVMLATVAFVPAAEAQQAPPVFSKSFTPATIGPGSVSTLRFDITNPNASPATALAFTDNLPTGVTIATPANVMSWCEGDLTAPTGGSTIDFSGGRIEGSSSCSVTVDVTSSTVGTHTNVSGDLTSSAGNSGPAEADLTVSADRPGFSKSFAPSTVFFGERSTLTFTIDNSANNSATYNLTFTDNLPDGMQVASPANDSTTCTGATLSADDGSSVIGFQMFGAASVAAESTCAVTVDVVANAAGDLHNVSGELISSPLSGPTRSSGVASATLTAIANNIALIKEFVDDPVAPGGTATLEFRIRNLDRGFDATQIAFTDDLEATLSGLAPNETLPKAACGGTVDFAGGTLSLSGGSISTEGECTFSVTLNVPAGAVDGAYPKTTTEITADVDGQTVTGNTAKDTLYVSSGPILSKVFTDDPVGSGGDVTLEFTITNSSTTSGATDIAFTDELTTFLPFPILVTPSNPVLPCGTGSSLSLISLGTERQGLSLTGGSLAAGGSCTFEVTITVPAGVASGIHTNTTSEVTASVGGEFVVGDPASDDLEVIGGPTLVKEFVDDPVQPGGTATLRFTLSHNANAIGDATDITFSDDLNATLAGLAATGLPLSDLCGTGNGSITGSNGDTRLDFSGTSLAPGDECAFDVTLSVPSGAAAGTYSNTTSNVDATVLGTPVTENPATDILKIGGLALTKEFIDDPTLPGANVTLRFTIENTSVASNAEGIFFQDDLDEALEDLAATTLPAVTDCGAGATLTGLAGNTLLRFEGGSLTHGESCTFDVELLVPVGAAEDTYASRTTLFSATFDGSPVAFDNAGDDLTILSDFLLLSKDFTDDPAIPGGTVTLEFTISNLGGAEITEIGFTDNLVGALPGLSSSSGTLNNVCGAGSSIGGTTLLTFANGTLAAGSSCTFSVTLSVDISVPNGTVATNIVSDASGTLAGQTVTADEATANLVIADPRDVPPSIESLVVAPEPSNEGQAVTATATFTGPAGAPDSSYTCTVDYGAGSGPVAGTIADFSCNGPPHIYPDNGVFPVTVTVTDNAARSDSESADHMVNNVAPMVSAPVVSMEPSDEGDTVTASATFGDAGIFDSPFTCTVDYGDGPVAGVIDGAFCTGPAHTYGDNGSFTVIVTVTDKDGGIGSASSNHTVNNVAPSVSAPVVTPVGPTDEGETVSASADFSDPGFDDSPFTCTVDYGDGALPVAGTVSGLTCAGPSHTYGDNGTYTVTVAVTDKDNGEGSASSDHQVDNVPPTVALDTTGAVAFPGGDAFIGRQGVPQEHQADGGDPGSDDLTFVWDFFVDSFSTTYYNDTGDPSGTPDPPNSSAGTFPFAATDTATILFPDPGAYEGSVELDDDDLGFDSQEFDKLVTGDQICVRGQGFWKHQFKSKKPHFDAETLEAYLDFVDHASSVFSELVPLHDADDAGDVLKDGGSKRDKAYSHTLAAWLNIASGAAAVDDVIEFANGSTATVLDVMFSIEDILLDAGASQADLVYAKDLAEAVNNLVNPNCDESSVEALFNYGIEVEFAKGCWVAYIPSSDDCIDCGGKVSELSLEPVGPGPVSGDLLLPGAAKGGGESCSAFGSTYLKILDQRLEWQISNTGSETITIDSITLYWPSEFGLLKKITLRNVTIFDHVIRPAATTIDAGWRGHDTDRQIEPGATKKLKLEFGNPREPDIRGRRPD